MNWHFENGIFKISFENIKIFITTKVWNNEYPLNYKIYSLKQIHSDKIIEVKRDSIFEEKGDGLFTYENDIILEVKTADCFPVFMFNENMIMVLHAGWQGVKNGIIEKGIKIFKEREGIKNLKIVLGAGIKKCCYEVKEDMIKYFEGFLEKRDKKIYFDLERFIIEKFLKEEIQLERISTFPYCTFCKNDIFYSNRRKDKKRNKGWIIKLSN